MAKPENKFTDPTDRLQSCGHHLDFNLMLSGRGNDGKQKTVQICLVCLESGLKKLRQWKGGN